MPNNTRLRQASPRRGEIWTAHLGDSRERHWVLVVSLDQRNSSENAQTVLIVPFSSRIADAPTTITLQPGETGLPGPSCLRGHFITTLPKMDLIERQPRSLSGLRMRQVCAAIRRSFDPEAG